MRLLHPGNGDERARLREKPSRAHRAGSAREPRGNPVPLHGLPQHREEHHGRRARHGRQVGEKMHAFHYHRPASLKDALSLGSQKTEGRYLAGGQSLVQAMKLRLSSPTDLIDLNALGDLKTLKAESGSVTIGAMVRHAEGAGSSGVKKTIPPLAALAGMIGDRQGPHMGTIRGPTPQHSPAARFAPAVFRL